MLRLRRGRWPRSPRRPGSAPRAPRRGGRASRAARAASPGPGSARARRGGGAASPPAPPSDSLSIRSARASGWARAASTAAARPTSRPACGPPRSLSPEKHTSAAPAATERRTSGSSNTAPSAPEPTSSITGTPELAQRLDRHVLDEPELAEVRLVHAQHGARVRAQDALVVGEPRAVRRSHLDQPRARLRDHVGHPEAAADLDQLAARDDDLAAWPGQGGRRQQRRARAVVDRERRLRPRQRAQQRLDVRVPRPARAGRQVQLEVRVADRGRRHRLARRLRQRRPPEVRVHDHAGRVQHPAQRGALGRLGPRPRAGAEIDLILSAREQLRAPLGQHRPRRGDAPPHAAPGPARPARPPAAGRADAHRTRIRTTRE